MKEKNSTTEKIIKPLNLVIIIVISIIFGIGGGLAALFAARTYLMPPVVNVPVSTTTDTSQENLRQANTIIENAKKIIAGQENKINDTISSGQNSLVGIFKKNQAAATSTATTAKTSFDITQFYRLSDAVGEGLVVTSDGWVLCSDFAKNIPEALVLKNFVIITRNNDVYNIDRIIPTGIDPYLFVHLAKANNLPVKSFVSKTDLTNSQSLVALNWQGESYLTSIVDKIGSDQAVKNSDVNSKDIIFANNLGDYFDNAFIFSLDGRVVGYFDKKNGPVPLYNFQPLIDGLLQGQESRRASLGLTYVNLKEYAIKDVGNNRGALIYSDTKSPAVKPGGSAALAGLKAGDVILSINNTTIDAQHDLNSILEQYSAGDVINIIYRRAGVENTQQVKLQELK